MDKTKSTLASNSDRCDNVLECYQLAKGTCTTIEVRICVNESNVLYKLYILVKCIYLSLLYIYIYI